MPPSPKPRPGPRGHTFRVCRRKKTLGAAARPAWPPSRGERVFPPQAAHQTQPTGCKRPASFIARSRHRHRCTQSALRPVYCLSGGTPHVDPFAPAADRTGTARAHTHARVGSGTHSQGTPTRVRAGLWHCLHLSLQARTTHTHSREGLPGGERHSSTNAQWTRLLHHRQKSWLADKKSPMPTRHVVMQVLAFTTAADAPSRGFPPEEQKDPKTCCAALCTSVWCLAITA